MKLNVKIETFLTTNFKNNNKKELLTKRSILQGLSNFVGDKYPFTHKQFSNFLNSEQFQNLAIGSQNLYKIRFQQFFKWLGIMDKKYMELLKRDGKFENNESLEEIKSLINFSNTFEGKIEEFLYEYTSIKEISKNNKRYVLKGISRFLGNKFPFDHKDISSYINSKKFQEYSISTQNRYKFFLKQFLKWLGVFDKRYKRLLDKIKDIKKVLKKSDLISKKEIQQILKRMSRSIDKALFMLLLESKVRSKELRFLKIKDLIFYDSYAVLYIRESKSAQRNIPLIESIPYLMRYLEDHPFREDFEAWFFGHIFKGEFRQYSRVGINNILKRNSQFLGKRIYTHLLRHTGLTQMAKHLTEFQLKQLAGWGMDSKMASRYVHLGKDDLENKILELHDIKIPEKEEKVSNIELVKCPRCDYINSELDKYCSRCGSVLDVKTVLEHKDLKDLLQSKYEDLGLKNQISSILDSLLEEKLRDIDITKLTVRNEE